MGVFSFIIVFSVGWDLGKRKAKFYFLDYKFVILGIVSFV